MFTIRRHKFFVFFLLFLFCTFYLASISNLQAAGPKKRIAILPFEVKAKNAHRQVGRGVSEMLMDALVNSGKYIVVERAELDEVFKEQNLGASGNVTNETAAKSGQLLGAQLLIKGVITEFKEKEAGGGIGGLIGGKVGIGIGQTQAHIAYTIRLIDVETGQVLKSHRAEEKVKKKGLAVATKIKSTPIGGALFKSASMEEAISKSLVKAIKFLDEETANMPWSGSVVMVDEDGAVYVNAGQNSGIKVGEYYEISHKGKALIDPETGLNLGAKTKKIGCIKIESVEEKYSVGTVVAGSGGQRKDIIKFGGDCASKQYKAHTPSKATGSVSPKQIPKTASTPKNTSTITKNPKPAQASNGQVAEDMTLFTKYDFVPGNKVIFYDDLSSDEEGEFPYRWKLDRGVFEVARIGDEKWIFCSDHGTIMPKLPEGPWPKRFTIELEFYAHGSKDYNTYYTIHMLDEKKRKKCKLVSYYYGNRSGKVSYNGKNISDKVLTKEYLSQGIHNMKIMVNERSIKCFIDETRIVNIPRDEDITFADFTVEVFPYANKDDKYPALIRNIRFAEGGKSMKQQLAETGKVITHGILFDVGSDIIKGESYKTLKEIGNLLKDDSALRLSIEGHTDSDGGDDYNMDLSDRRAQSVVQYLSNNFGIDSSRLEFKGWGESKPVDTNDTSEGKANNRRVELVKI